MTPQDTIDRLLEQRPIPVCSVVTELTRASRDAVPADFDVVLGIARLNDVFDERLAYPAMALMPAWGVGGIDALCALAAEGPHESVAFSILSTISLGRVPSSADVPFLGSDWDSSAAYVLAPNFGAGDRSARQSSDSGP